LLTGLTLVGIFIGIKQFRKTEKGQVITDKIMLRLPIFGVLLKKVSVANLPERSAH